MDKIKVLLFTNDYRNYVTRNIYYFSQELAIISDLVTWSNPGDINSILKQIRFRPDFILINDLMPSNCPIITGLSSVDIPKGIILEDLWDRTADRKIFFEKNDIKYLFTICRDAFLSGYTEYIDRMYWLPHFVNTDIFKDYNLPKDIDYLMMGNTFSKHYQFRKHMVDVMLKEPGFVFHPHPGYRYINDSNAYVGEKYAREINRAKIFLTDDSIYHYPIKKYYEVLACKTLLLAPASIELADLGFIPGVNFVEIAGEDFVEKARYYLVHKSEREDIAQKGYEMVHSRHSAQKRVYEFIQILEGILSN